MKKFLVVFTLFTLLFIISCGPEEDCREATTSKPGYKCNEKSGFWEKLKNGETGEVESVCESGEFRCSGSESHYCNSFGEWVFDARCKEGCDSSTGQCRNDSLTDPTEPTNPAEPTEPTESCTTIDSNMWSSLSSDEMYWNDAVSYCNNLTECGYSDWRLPNINELRTLIKNCPGTVTGGSCAVKDPDCLSYSSCWSEDCRCEFRENNGGYYSKLGDDDYVYLWSSSVLSDSSDLAWNVHFLNGNVYNSIKSLTNSVRCVR